MKVALLSPPFWGHLNSILALISSLRKKHEITLFAVEWKDVPFPSRALKLLLGAGVPHVIDRLEGDPGTRPTDFICQKLGETLPRYRSLLAGFDLIIYDFFMLEGNLLGRLLNIPAVCSIPAFLGPHQETQLQEWMAPHQELLEKLRSRYGVDLKQEMESASDGLILRSPLNLVWSSQELMELGEYERHRQPQHRLWVYYEVPPQKKPFFPTSKKKIYCSFGTVVMNNLARKSPKVKTFVYQVLFWLCDWVAEREEVSLIIASAGEFEYPTHPRIQIRSFVPQKEVLHHADLFVTHGGCNGVNEAIAAQTPMLVIPFFGDQLHLGETLMKAGVAISFAPDRRSIDTEHGVYERETLTDTSFTSALYNLLYDAPQSYRRQIIQYRDQHVMTSTPLLRLGETFEFWLAHQSPRLRWREGDLLFGTTLDRLEMARMTGDSSFYEIGKMIGFHHLFEDHARRYPRLVDQYHDLLTIEKNYEEFLAHRWETPWSQWVREYREFLLKNPDFLQPIGKLPFPNDVLEAERALTLWNMCLGGMDFFLIQKRVQIHFVIGSYSDRVNLATKLELEYIQRYQKDPIFQSQINYYRLDPEKKEIRMVDPEHSDWFKTS